MLSTVSARQAGRGDNDRGEAGHGVGGDPAQPFGGDDERVAGINHRLAVELDRRGAAQGEPTRTCSVSMPCSGPACPGRMSTRQTTCVAPPCVGEASVVMVALGVSVRRLSEWRLSGHGVPPIWLVNVVVHL